jgi:hypothetical protein
LQAGIAGIKAFVTGTGDTSPTADAPVVHAAVKRWDDLKRADFEVYLKKFLMSLDIILPHASGAALSRAGAAFRLHPAGGQGALQGRVA